MDAVKKTGDHIIQFALAITIILIPLLFMFLWKIDINNRGSYR